MNPLLTDVEEALVRAGAPRAVHGGLSVFYRSLGFPRTSRLSEAWLCRTELTVHGIAPIAGGRLEVACYRIVRQLRLIGPEDYDDLVALFREELWRGEPTADDPTEIAVLLDVSKSAAGKLAHDGVLTPAEARRFLQIATRQGVLLPGGSR